MTFRNVTFLFLVLFIASIVQAASTPQVANLNSELAKLAADFSELKSHIPPNGPHYEKILRYTMMGVFGRWQRLRRQMDQLAPSDRDTLLARFALLRANIENLEAQAYPGLQPAALKSFKGRITGTIAGPNDVPLEARIVAYNTCGTISGYAYTEEDGTYELENLPTGDYYIIADAYDYIGELYDNNTCFQGNCDPYKGTAVSVVDGSTSSGIDFTLRRAGSISGVVKGGGVPLEYFDVDAVDEHGEWVAYGDAIDKLGNYRIDGLDGGVYYVYTETWYDFINEIYDNIPCLNRYCYDVTAGTPISVTLGQDTGDINFDLHPLASITGIITDEASGEPLVDVSVYAYNEDGWWIGSASTNWKGKYIVTGLYQGRYYIRTRNDQGYQDELYDNIPCINGDCDILTGHQVIVDPGQKKTKIRFQLKHE